MLNYLGFYFLPIFPWPKSDRMYYHLMWSKKSVLIAHWLMNLIGCYFLKFFQHWLSEQWYVEDGLHRLEMIDDSNFELDDLPWPPVMFLAIHVNYCNLNSMEPAEINQLLLDWIQWILERIKNPIPVIGDARTGNDRTGGPDTPVGYPTLISSTWSISTSITGDSHLTIFDGPGEPLKWTLKNECAPRGQNPFFKKCGARFWQIKKSIPCIWTALTFST